MSMRSNTGGVARKPARFRLMQYFVVTSLIAFTLVGIALFFLERAESTFFAHAQQEQGAFFGQAQDEFVREQKKAARANLLADHEGDHLTLARILANALWEPHFAPLVARAQSIPVDSCRGLPQQARAACEASLGARIAAIPGFANVDAAVHAMMRGSSVFKVKVYDLRGLTVYSSERAQIGEDKADNAGWRTALGGKPASELVHRDRFSAFEGVVQNRDLIQSYIPVLAPGERKVSGVFEIYSDVTGLLQEIDNASRQVEAVAAANARRLQQSSADYQRRVDIGSAQHFAILGSVMVALYLALLFVVRHGQALIDEQARAREAAALREQDAHREKMAALATMAANASHEIRNPLAVITGLAEEMERASAAGESVGNMPRMVMEQAARIADMTQRITDFASTRGDTPEPLDVNPMVKAVCDFLGFDERYRRIRIEPKLAPQLPASLAIREHLNEVLMDLVQAHAEEGLHTGAASGRIVVATGAKEERVFIDIRTECGAGRPTGALAATDVRVDSARRLVEAMNGQLESSAAGTRILLRGLSGETHHA